MQAIAQAPAHVACNQPSRSCGVVTIIGQLRSSMKALFLIKAVKSEDPDLLIGLESGGRIKCKIDK
jgi:hypothetical protein